MKYVYYTPIAYDYQYAYPSIMSYYDIADEIILLIDKDRISWSNLSFKFDFDSFKNKIEEIDKNKKIKIIEENFHLYKQPIRNDTYERNYVSKIVNKDDYLIGIDSDEILLNPKEFKEWLDSQKRLNFDIECLWYTVYKNFGRKLLITEPMEPAVIGTNLKNRYKKCRITKNVVKKTPLKVLHFSWGRSLREVLQKIYNWSHSADFKLGEYMRTWSKVTLENYEEFKYFHPLKLNKWWKSLKLVELEKFDLSEELIKEIVAFLE